MTWPQGVLIVLAIGGACETPQVPSAGSVARARPQVEVVPAPAPTPSLDPEAAVQLKAASKTLAAKGCVPGALEVVRTLHAAHGDLPPLVEAQRVAYEACNDPEALAQLLARTMPDEPPGSQRLELGATWVRAARYDEAVAVLEPLAREEGPRSQAAWLAGFALFHAGAQDRALPLLESARQHAAKDVSDAWLMIGLSKLETGDVKGATAELEAGVQAVTDDPFLWTALARAYTAGGRREDATRAEARATTTRAARSGTLRSQMWLAARAMELGNAAEAQDIAGVERAFDQLWPDAPSELRRQMLELRAEAYAKAGREDDAEADRDRAETLRDPR